MADDQQIELELEGSAETEVSVDSEAGSEDQFEQAENATQTRINRLTKKPVLCTENFEMIFDSQSLKYNIKSGKYFPFLRKIALKIRDKIRKN